MMTKNENTSMYGKNIWRLIPEHWRYWFVESIKEMEEDTRHRNTKTISC